MMCRLLSLCCLMIAAPAVAGPGVYVDLNPVVPLGKKPSVNVVTKERVKALRLHIVRSDGHEIKKKSTRLIRNKRVRFYLDQPEGTFTYEGTRDLAAVLSTRVEGENPPDVAMMPNVGALTQYKDDLVPLSEAGANLDNYAPSWLELVTVDGEV